MYIDDFYFSPFEIKDNVLTIWLGEYKIENGKIFNKGGEVSPEEFYLQFTQKAEGTWFSKDFVKAFENKKSALPDSMVEFAVYCQTKSQLFNQF